MRIYVFSFKEKGGLYSKVYVTNVTLNWYFLTFMKHATTHLYE